MKKGLTTRELAKKLKISPSTLRIWEDLLNLEVPRDERKRRVYPVEMQELLVKVAELRVNGYDYKSIAEMLHLTYQEAGLTEAEAHEPAEEPLEEMAEERQPEAVPMEPESDSLQNLPAPVLQEKYMAMASEYAKATYTIGQLEERVRLLSQQLEEKKREQQWFLPLEQKVAELAHEVKNKDDLVELQQQMKLLTLTMLSQRPKGFWGKLKELFS